MPTEVEMEMEEDCVRAAATAEEAVEEEEVEEEEEVVQCVEARKWLCRREGRRLSTGIERRSGGGSGGTRGAFSWA